MTSDQRKRKNAAIVEWRNRQSPEKKAARVEYERQRQLKIRRAKAAMRGPKNPGPVPMSPEIRQQKQRESRKRWSEANRQKHLESCRIYRSSRTKDQKEAERKAQRAWCKKNLDKRISDNHRRRARLAGVGGSHTAEQWKELVNRYGHQCAHCNRRDSEVKLTRDHIIPIIKGGSNSIENIQPLCLSCNCKKGGL